ncbi:Atrial natriuretic peptide receptor 2 [Hypsibius exemplaris]|uniref:guanylate cyclase n=1 Tax=Hypsibius exemplaris TaxID=2072580 RepID=A0A1W0WPH5_HYPEX|nr:Atrial natriuretic peptide receptor 2 [Hypsibius exemplaris]
MTDGSYVYFIMDQFPYDTGVLSQNSASGWFQTPNPATDFTDAQNNILRFAYQSVFVLAVQDTSASQAALDFTAAAAQKVHDTGASGTVYYYNVSEPFVQNYFTRAFYDCLLIVARGISYAVGNGTITQSASSTALFKNYAYGTASQQTRQQDITATLKYVANTSFDGASGKMKIKPNRDREEDFYVLAMTDRAQGEFSKVAIFSAVDSTYTEYDTMIWPNNKSAPLNKPECGYNNNEGPCAPVTHLVEIAAGCGGGAGFLLLLTAICYYCRAKRLTKSDKAWIARWHELEVLRPGGPSFSVKGDESESESEKEKKTKEQLDEKDVEFKKKKQAPNPKERLEGKTIILDNAEVEAVSHKTQAIKITANTGIWMKNAVTVRWSKKRRLNLSGSILKQAREKKSLTHENLMKFLGACLEDDRILIIYENCSKGSLTELIADPNTKLEWAMRFSLMSDCMKAISYLHKSVLKVHGRLTSMCCYIDSRFMLKVGDYGLNAFFDLTLAELWAAKREPDYLTAQMWKAPEHLRAEALSRYEVISSVSQKGDVYSFGIVVQELVLRSKPFAMYALSEEEIIDLIRQSASETNPRFIPKIDESACPLELIDLCDRCWSVDTGKRPNMLQIRAFLKELGKQLGMGERSNILDTLLQQMEDMENNLQAIIDEKGQVLLNQKNQSDQLLYSVLPKYANFET